ncbi:MAG: DNA internalization-related competence protein ComEC/Rec2 [Gammaproteobacteria bacterium]
MQRQILLYLIAITGGLLVPHALPLAVACAGLVLAAALALPPRTRALAALLAGLAWSSIHVDAYRGALPAIDARGSAVAIRGRVVDFARDVAGGASFELMPPAQGFGARLAAVRIAVRGYPGPPPPPGAWCELRVVIGAARGLANRGVSDRERAWAARRIGATARVVPHPANRCAAIAPRASFARWRAWLSRAIDAAVVDPRHAAVVRALAIADRSTLDDAHWELVRATGTAHLLAISGLHVALAAALAFVVCRILAGLPGWRYQAYPAVRLAWFGAVAAAALYAGLAGFGVPARRAALMVALAAAAALGGRRVLSIEHLLIALAVMATLDPFALLGEGLWLSFGAVAILLWQGSRVGRARPAWLRAWRVHLALAAGMAPLIAAIFGTVPLLAPVANLVAVPWCSVLVVPLVFAGIVLAPLNNLAASLAWDMAARLWSWLEGVLDMLASVPLAVTLEVLTLPGLVLLALGMLLCALPRGLGLRRLGLLLILAGAGARESAAPWDGFEARVLDVGQGLAVVVRTAHHVLLYDTGPRWWPSGDDAGRAVVAPALRQLGVAQLDAVVVSHSDGDHVGGLRSVLAAVAAARVHAPRAAALPAGVTATPCEGAADWQWDGVSFRWLHAGALGGGTRNDGSCVLLVTSAHGRLLLSGDIERRAEAALVSRHAAALAAEVLLVPHHGSATSSSRTFVAAVAPRHAVIASGHRNRYGLPDAAVVARYRAAGAQVLDTARDGAITLRFAASGIDVHTERGARIGFWSRPATAAAGKSCATFDC